MLGCGHCFGGRIPVVFGREMEMDGMVTGPRAQRIL